MVKTSNQIKSATSNEGMFSESGNIRYSRKARQGTGLSREAVIKQIAKEYGIKESEAFRVVEGKSAEDGRGRESRGGAEAWRNAPYGVAKEGSRVIKYGSIKKSVGKNEPV